MEKLTEKQQLVFDKIKLFVEKNGYSPSVRELCFFTDMSSPATVHYHLKHLKEKGYIDYSYNKNRTIKILKDDINNEKRIIETLEKYLLNTYEIWKDSEVNYEIAMECMYIYNYIQELKRKFKNEKDK